MADKSSKKYPDPPPEVIVAHRKWEASPERNNDSWEMGPLHEWLHEQDLEEMHKRLEAGDKSVILEALDFCFVWKIPVPQWCADTFKRAVRKVRNYEARSWDDVFCRPHPKHTQLKTERERVLELFAYLDCRRYHEKENIPIDDTFERVGRDLGLGGRTKVSEIYYKWRDRLKIS